MSFSRLFWFQTSTVIGCEGLTSRAHLITFLSKGKEVVPRPPLVGSLYKSQIKIRGSFLKRPITALTYFSIFGCEFESMTILCPGLGDQAHAYQPFNGSGCFPTFGSCSIPNMQSSKRAGMNLILCLSHIAINLSRVFRKYSGSSS